MRQRVKSEVTGRQARITPPHGTASGTTARAGGLMARGATAGGATASGATTQHFVEAAGPADATEVNKEGATESSPVPPVARVWHPTL